jgi:long-chain fatty acid transport protein
MDSNKEVVMKTKFRKAALAAAVAGTFAGASTGVQAGAFALIEQNASGLGNAYAGAAAVAEDASTIFFNPAGMSLIDRPQLVVAGHVIAVSADFSGTGSRPLALGGGTFSGTADAGESAFVPNLYFAMPINERMHFGVGLNVPFGLTTDYDDNWVGRFQGIKSELMTVNINPSISYMLSDTVSIGAGINYQRADVELTNASVTGAGEGRTKLEADDDAWGWNVGVLFQAGPATKVGVAYRSVMDYSLEGDATTIAAGAIQPAGTFAAKADATFPDMVSLSLAHALSDRLELLADATFTRWSELEAVRVIDGTGTTRDVLDFDFNDTWRYSVGANYKWNDQWTLKAGVAYDQTPVKNAQTRTVRLPDNDRTWVALGAQAKVGQAGRVDVGYAHLFIKDADIDHQRSQLGVPAGLGDSRVTGKFEGSVDIFSIQYTHNF